MNWIRLTLVAGLWAIPTLAEAAQIHPGSAAWDEGWAVTRMASAEERAAASQSTSAEKKADHGERPADERDRIVPPAFALGSSSSGGMGGASAQLGSGAGQSLSALPPDSSAPKPHSSREVISLEDRVLLPVPFLDGVFRPPRFRS